MTPLSQSVVKVYGREEVLKMVDLHYSECLIEPLTFSTFASSNKVN